MKPKLNCFTIVKSVSIATVRISMYEELIPKLSKLEQGYNKLDDIQLVDITFNYVQDGLDIPPEIVDELSTRGLYSLIEPLLDSLGEIEDDVF